MIQPLDSPAVTEATAQPATSGPQSGKSFAALLHANGKVASGATTGVPEGETWAPVPGHHDYAKIVSGPRKGKYINLASNERHGRAFTIEHRNGKTLHVYRSGGRETVVGAGPVQSRASSAAADQPPKGEVWAPVAGTTLYADILNGPRNGLYVNTSGNSRDGMAFEIVNRDGKTFHVYGSGKNRVSVEVLKSPHHNQPAQPAPVTPLQAGDGGVATPAS